MTESVAAEWNYDDFVAGTSPLPSPNLAWNSYGKGIESIGVDGKPEPAEIPDPAPNQLLIRIDAVGLCFSDVKLITQGGDHPKLYGRDLATEPTRLGHEATVTVVEVGSDLASDYHPGQRLAIQPDIHVDGRSSAYGYTIPGGLIQYHLIGPEVLDADDGAYVIDVADQIGYAAAALSEPWACVEASYTQRRRLEPKVGGTMWIVGTPGDEAVYDASRGLDAPATIIVSDLSESNRAMVDRLRNPKSTVIEENDLTPEAVAEISVRLTGEDGFDDLVVLGSTSASLVTELAKVIGFRGTMALVGTEPLDGDASVDVGRIHYHYTAYVGTSGSDIAAAWGEARNRADVKPGGVIVVVGAGGPMGQMHLQRAIEKADGPATIIGVDLDDVRLAAASALLKPMAAERGRELIMFNPGGDNDAVAELVKEKTGGRGADDVVVSVPIGPVMGTSAKLLADDGMLVAFAGVPNGTMAPLDLSSVYLGNTQFTGTSGSSIDDQAAVLNQAVEGSLSPERALAAVGGIGAGQDGVRALLEGHYAGKVVIFPQLEGLALTGIDKLAESHPDIAAVLGPDNSWTNEAERVLFETYHS